MSITMSGIYRYITKMLSRWSVEFSMLLSVAFLLLELGLIDVWVIKTILSIAIFLFFGGFSHKLILAMYKDHLKVMKEIKECVGKNDGNNT